MDPAKIRAAQLHAVMIAGKKAAKRRDELEVKSYRIDFAAHFRGTLTVSDESTFASPDRISQDLLLAALLEMVGPRKRKTVVNALIADADRIRKGAIEETAKLQAARLIDETAVDRTVTRRGAVAGKIDLAML